MWTISIKGVDKVNLLRVLWNEAQYAAFFENIDDKPVFDEDQAKEAVVSKYIEYFCGKSIHCDLSADKVKFDEYDKRNGNGLFVRCLSSVKQPQAEQTPRCPRTPRCMFVSLNVPLLRDTCQKCGKLEKEHHEQKKHQEKQIKRKLSNVTQPSKKQKGCVFTPWGKPMLNDDPGTIICGTCGRFKKHH